MTYVCKPRPAKTFSDVCHAYMIVIQSSLHLQQKREAPNYITPALLSLYFRASAESQGQRGAPAKHRSVRP